MARLRVPQRVVLLLNGQLPFLRFRFLFPYFFFRFQRPVKVVQRLIAIGESRAQAQVGHALRQRCQLFLRHALNSFNAGSEQARFVVVQPIVILGNSVPFFRFLAGGFFCLSFGICGL